MSKFSELRDEYRASLKSSDTEEWFDLIFYRPIGFAWAVLCRKIGVTPNAITIASIVLGLGAAVAFYYNNFWINLAGVLLLMWADAFDSADGQLARLTHNYSRLGRILDGLSGDIWFVAIYIAICLRENVTSDFFMSHQWVIWLVAAAAGACHAVQAAMADSYRQFHLYFLKGEEGSELESGANLRRKFAELSWKRNFIQKLVLMFYMNYTLGQENRTPRMQSLRRTIADRFGNRIPRKFRDDFRTLSKPLMKYTNILSFNVRSFALFASILIFQMPWLYFAFEITVLNALLIYMMVRHERICRNLKLKIDSGYYDE